MSKIPQFFFLILSILILACQSKDLQELSVEELDKHIITVTSLLDSLQTIRDSKARLDTTGKYGTLETTDIEHLFENRRVVTIKGKVDSSLLINSIRIVKDRPYQPDFIQSIPVAVDGSFSDEFEIESNGLFEIKFKDHSYELYLENSKTLGIIVDTLLDDDIRFIGDLSEENNYLMSSHEYLSDHHEVTIESDSYTSQEYESFIQHSIDSLQQSLDLLKENNSSSVSGDFTTLINQKLKLIRSRALLDFAATYKDSLSNEYFEATDIDLNTSELFHLFEFRKYLFEYFEYTADKILADSLWNDKAKTDYFTAKYMLVDRLFSNQTITEFLKTDVIFESIGEVRHAGINSLVMQFQSNVSNRSFKNTINDRYKSIIKATSGTLASELTGITSRGEDFRLSELRGKYVYIFVWATWCGPCKVEIPFYKQMLEDYGDENIEFVGISVDKDKQKWMDSFLYDDYPGLQVLIPGDWKSPLVRDYNIASIPQFILINPKGEIAALHAERPTKNIKAQLSQYGIFAKVY